jgi:peptidyl-prolyl cis-trans isomerase C
VTAVHARRRALAFACASVCFIPAMLHAEDKVIARLNGVDIMQSDLDLANGEIGQALAELPPPSRQRVLVEYLIETRLFADAAEGEKLAAEPGFDKRLAYWRQRALRDAYYEKAVKGSISDAVVRGIYDDKVKGLAPQEEVQARHILVETEEQAKALADEIAKGGDFAALAKEHSKDPGSKGDGGMLGYFGQGQMVAPFEQAAFSLKAGELSKPVKTQFGWHLIKVEDRRQKPPPPYEQVKDRILSSMVQSKAQDVAKGLRGKATIEYVDADLKKQVDEDAKKADAQQKAFEEQVDKMGKQ